MWPKQTLEDLAKGGIRFGENALSGLPSNSHNKSQSKRQKNIHRQERERVQDTLHQPQDHLQAQKSTRQ